MKRKTATIERYHVYGTRDSYMARVMYRGRVLSHWQSGYCSAAHFPAPGGFPYEWEEIARNHAKRHGCTHVRFIGNFQGVRKPRGGRL